MRNYSGKLLISAMLLAALAAAGASWWFRYEATHLTAQFWGPEAARLIRDAPEVELLVLRRNDAAGSIEQLNIGGTNWLVADKRDVSQAPGLTHLRNALLEDHSFDWPVHAADSSTDWRWALRFRDGKGPRLVALFSADEQLGKSFAGDESIVAVSCRPISRGLSEMYVEMIGQVAAHR
jgi:hypothetical protein